MAEISRVKTFDAQGHAHLVAVKRVLAHLAEDDDFIQMLVDEAKIASVLRHASIARVAEVARALHAAHSAVDAKRRPLRIVHRDVSPSNIIASYTGEVKLCDFGIAK